MSGTPFPCAIHDTLALSATPAIYIHTLALQVNIGGHCGPNASVFFFLPRHWHTWPVIWGFIIFELGFVRYPCCNGLGLVGLPSLLPGVLSLMNRTRKMIDVVKGKYVVFSFVCDNKSIPKRKY